MIVYFHNFNSIKVRLKPAVNAHLSALFAWFQFHKGTIETAILRNICDKYNNFNSIKVRLKHELQMSFSTDYINFNSIKVRLKPSKVCPPWVASSFQFHKGTIETPGKAHVRLVCGNFNSIKVRLKRCRQYNTVHRRQHFNSIKVRLKLAPRLAWVLRPGISIP